MSTLLSTSRQLFIKNNYNSVLLFIYLFILFLALSLLKKKNQTAMYHYREPKWHQSSNLSGSFSHINFSWVYRCTFYIHLLNTHCSYCRVWSWCWHDCGGIQLWGVRAAVSTERREAIINYHHHRQALQWVTFQHWHFHICTFVYRNTISNYAMLD